MDDNILNMKEASKLLKLAKITLYKYVRDGSIPAFKLGRCWKFERSALDAWIKNRITVDTQTRSDNKKQ